MPPFWREEELKVSWYERLLCRVVGHSRIVIDMDPSDQSQLMCCVRCHRQKWEYVG